MMWLSRYLTLSFLIVESSRAIRSADRNKRTIIGYYPACPPGCASCSAANGCVSCKPRLFLYLHRDGMTQMGMCVPACPRGYYGVEKTSISICYKCAVPHCEACFNQQHCTRCRPPFLALNGSCVESCPKGLHYAAYTKECKKMVNCEASPWSSWGMCERDRQVCGYKYGLQVRTRDILQLSSPKGKRCPITSESRRCRMVYRACVDLLHNSSDLSKALDKPLGKSRKKVHKRDRKSKKLSHSKDRQSRRRHRARKLRRRGRKHRKREKIHLHQPAMKSNSLSDLELLA